MKTRAVTAAGERESESVAARRVTLDDLAQKTGLHRTTISQVLNDHPKCWASAATRELIREAAAELGYRPNLSARALRVGHSRVIGFSSPGFAAGTPHSRAGGLTEAATAADYTVTLSSHANASESEDVVLQRMLDSGVAGLAIYPVDPGPHQELRRLVARGFPVVTFEGATLLDFECDDISMDFAAIGRLQAQHLLRLGRRRVCLANTFPEARITAVREAAVRQELARAGAPPPLEMRLQISAARELQEAETLEAPMQCFLQEHHGAFDAVIGRDPMASLTVRFLLEQGLRIPEDVAVVGGGESLLSSYGAVPLTVVDTADDVAGSQAFGLLLERMQRGGNSPFRRLLHPARLIVRKSTQAEAK